MEADPTRAGIIGRLPQAGTATAAADCGTVVREEAERAMERCLGPFALDLLGRSAQPFIVVELAGPILRANRAFSDLLGYEPGRAGRPVDRRADRGPLA